MISSETYNENDIHTKFFEAINLLLQKDFNEYSDLLKEINDISPEKIISSIIQIITDGTYEELGVISVIIRDLNHLHALPAEIIKTMKIFKSNKETIIRLIFLYSSLFLLGYNQPISVEDLLDGYSVNEEQFSDIGFQIFDLMKKKLQDFDSDAEFGNALNFEKIIEEIIPFQSTTRFHHETEAFTSLISKKIPIERFLNDLERISNNADESKSFMKPIPKLQSRVNSLEARKISKLIDNRMKEGNYKGLLRYFVKLQNLEPKNSLVYYYKSKIIREIPNFSNPQKKNVLVFNELEKCLRFASNEAYIEYYFDLAVSLEMMGCFKSAYLLNLKLIIFSPNDQQLNISAAFCAYQLLRPFKHFLYYAALCDPLRTANFIDEFWIFERFKPQDRFKKSNFFPETVKNLEEVFIEVKLEYYSIISLPNNTLQSLGDDFPYEKYIGYYPFSGDQYDDSVEDSVNLLRKPLIDSNDFYDSEFAPHWIKSKEFLMLPKYTWKTRNHIPFFITNLIYHIFQLHPAEWTWEILEKILLKIIPKYDLSPKYYFKSILKVMQNFCDFLVHELDYQHLSGFSRKIKEISEEFYLENQNSLKILGVKFKIQLLKR